MPHDRPFARSLALAACMHLCGVAGVMLYVRTHAPPRAETAPLEITIDESPEPPPPPAVPDLPRPAPLAPLPSTEAVASVSPRRLPSRARAEASAEPFVPLVASPEPSASASTEPWSAPVFRTAPGGPAQIGLTPEERARSLAAAGAAGESAGSAGHDVGGLKQALSEHDVALGMGHGGPLITAVEDVTSGSRAPIDGAATFVVDTDEAGEVTSVRAVEVTSDEEAWREVAGLLLAKMKKHPLHVHPGGRGVTVTLQVQSRLQQADGASARPKLPLGARVALFPLKVLAGAGSFDVTELSSKEFRRIDAWEVDERPR